MNDTISKDVQVEIDIFDVREFLDKANKKELQKIIEHANAIDDAKDGKIGATEVSIDKNDIEIDVDIDDLDLKLEDVDHLIEENETELPSDTLIDTYWSEVIQIMTENFDTPFKAIEFLKINKIT